MSDTTPAPGFFDGLGDRVIVRDRTAGALEVLRLRTDLTADAAFEPKVRARVQQLAALQHQGLARVRHVGRLAAPDNRLAIVSDLADGLRLSEILQATEQMSLPLHTNAALFLLRQLVSAVACLHGAGPDVSHGALAPERLVVSSTGRLVVVEHVLGSALPHLPHPQPPRVWKDLRVALPPNEEPPFGRRADVLQVGLCGLALVLGRPLRLEEYPLQLRELLDRATESTVTGDRRPLRAPLRSWLERAMEAAEPAEAPWTIDEARRALDSLLAADGYLATPTGLSTLLESVKRYFAGSDLDPAKAASPEAAPKPPAETGRAHLASPAPPPPPASAQSPQPAPTVAPPAAPVQPPPAASVQPPPAPAPPAPVAPVARLRLVSPPQAPSPLSPAPWSGSLQAPRDAGAVRTEGSLAVATPLAVPPEAAPDDSFAPEAGVSFPPDEPEPEPIVSAPALPPPPPRAASGAVPVAAPTLPAGSGAVPVAEPVAEPIAASLARESLAELVHTRPGSGHRASSGSIRPSRSMFGAEPDRGVSSHSGGSSLPLKLGGAAGMLIALAAAGWFIFGSGKAPEKGATAPERRTAVTAPAPKPAAPEPAAPVEPAPARVPGGSEVLPASMAGAAAAAEEAGSLQIESPFALEVFEDGVRLGTTDAPIVLAAGRHQIDLVNRDYAFRGRQAVEVRPGRATRVAAKLPTGLANINAAPWAEVWIDGVRAGETPLGNLSLTIGPHGVVFRHPQLGEQKRTLVVTEGAATRLSVEMQQ
ncbi:MAG TPA: hypothetical protein PKK95_07565 [Vicinamibacterales bacterium]|nr:hypothetical protein [Vicinamibacterales bacterium]